MAGLVEQIEPLKKAALAELNEAADLAALEQAKAHFLGTHGKFTALMKQLGALAKEERPQAGKLINVAKVELESALAQRRSELELKAASPKEPADFTAPGRRRTLGKLHPLTQTTEDIVRSFRKIGFVVADGPEIEDRRDPQHTARYVGHDSRVRRGENQRGVSARRNRSCDKDR
jgi:phenylalanyl-tRNA synthetase alpha chain